MSEPNFELDMKIVPPLDFNFKSQEMANSDYFNDDLDDDYGD